MGSAVELATETLTTNPTSGAALVMVIVTDGRPVNQSPYKANDGNGYQKKMLVPFITAAHNAGIITFGVGAGSVCPLLIALSLESDQLRFDAANNLGKYSGDGIPHKE